MPNIESHFERADANVRATYDRLLAAARAFGPVEEDPKKTSIHLNRRSAFAGVATRRKALVLTIKASADVQSERVLKHEQASANRWHLEVRLSDPRDVDAELVGWLAAAYNMSA